MDYTWECLRSFQDGTALFPNWKNGNLKTIADVAVKAGDEVAVKVHATDRHSCALDDVQLHRLPNQ